MAATNLTLTALLLQTSNCSEAVLQPQLQKLQFVPDVNAWLKLSPENIERLQLDPAIFGYIQGYTNHPPKADPSKITLPPLPFITRLSAANWYSVSLEATNSNRRDARASSILLTVEMSRTLDFLLGHFSPGRYEPNEGPGMFFLSGLSGTGKSCLLKIFADKIKDTYQVFYAREPYLLPTPLPVSEDVNKPLVIIMDQADKAPGPSLLDSLPGRNRIAVVCASANMVYSPSMSNNFTTVQCKLKLSLTYAEFCDVVFHYTGLQLQSNYSELNGTFDSWISFQPTCFEDLYTFTQGHAMSVVRLCGDFKEARKATDEPIEATIKSMLESSFGLTATLIELQKTTFIQKPNSFFMLNNMFENKMLELSSQHADERFFLDCKIYSPLYLQACSKAFHSFTPLEPESFMSVVTSLHCGNATFRGILVERLALGNEMFLFDAAVSCLKAANIDPPPKPTSIETVFWTGTTLGHAKDPGDFVHYIPSVCNFPHVDLLQIYTWTARGTRHTLLLGNQITIQSSHEHRSSLSWFDTLSELEAELLDARKPTQLHSFLLYSCGRDSDRPQNPPSSDKHFANRRVFQQPYWRLLTVRQAKAVGDFRVSFDTSEVVATKARKAQKLEEGMDKTPTPTVNVERGRAKKHKPFLENSSGRRTWTNSPAPKRPKQNDQAAKEAMDKTSTPTVNVERGRAKTHKSLPENPSARPCTRQSSRVSKPRKVDL